MALSSVLLYGPSWTSPAVWPCPKVSFCMGLSCLVLLYGPVLKCPSVWPWFEESCINMSLAWSIPPLMALAWSKFFCMAMNWSVPPVWPWPEVSSSMALAWSVPVYGHDLKCPPCMALAWSIPQYGCWIGPSVSVGLGLMYPLKCPVCYPSEAKWGPKITCQSSKLQLYHNTE